jgi:hypothetical protein
MDDNLPPSPKPDISKRRRNIRNIAVFAALLGFVVLVYAITIVKIKLGYAP